MPAMTQTNFSVVLMFLVNNEGEMHISFTESITGTVVPEDVTYQTSGSILPLVETVHR